jgi:hypothetical protein
MMVDPPSEPEHTPMPCPLEKGKMPAIPTPSPAPLPVPTPLTTLPCAPAQVPCAPRPKPLAPPCATAPAAPSAPPPTSYAKAAATLPKPKFHARPSLIVHLHQMSLTAPLRDLTDCKAPMFVNACNHALSSEARHANMWVAAAKWSPVGNLVVFAGLEMSLVQLQAAHHIIVRAIEAALLSPTPLSSCPNIKWNNVLINCICYAWTLHNCNHKYFSDY